MELKFPAPCVAVLIGPSSAGNSTWAADHFALNEVVSSDSLRAAVGIDQDDQQASAAAFDLLNRIVTERLARELTTVIDTTGLNAEDRKRWVAQSHDAGLSCHAILFDTAAELCEQRNNERTRPLPNWPQANLREQIRGQDLFCTRTGLLSPPHPRPDSDPGERLRRKEHPDAGSIETFGDVISAFEES